MLTSTVAGQVYIPPAVIKGPFVYIFASTSFCFLNECHSDWGKMESHCSFDLNLKAEGFRFCFFPPCLVDISISSFENCLLISLLCLLTGLFDFLLLSFF